MLVEHERLLLPQSLAYEAQCQNRHLLDEQILVVDVRTDLLHNSLPLVPGNLDAAYRSHHVCRSSPDISIMIDHY